MKSISGRFLIIHLCISMNMFRIFYSEQNITFRGAKSGSNKSSFEWATLPTTWGSYLSLNIIEWLAKPSVFENILLLLKNRNFCEILQKSPKNLKIAIAQKLSINLKFWSLHNKPQSKVLQKRADNFFQYFPRKVILFYTSVYSNFIFFAFTCETIAFKIWFKIHIIKDITKGNNGPQA